MLNFTFFLCYSMVVPQKINTELDFGATSLIKLCVLPPTPFRVQTQARPLFFVFVVCHTIQCFIIVHHTTFLGVSSRWQIGGETVNNSPFHMNGDVAEIVVFTRSLSQVWPSVETIT